MPFLKVRQHLAQSEGFILQSLLAAGLGLAVALVVLAFHGLIDLLIMAVGEPSSWEIWQVLALPTLGALIVFAILKRYPKRASFGLRHVVNELHHAPWHWPTTNAFLQFFLTPIVLASGQSGGREGPAVHLGATLGAMTTERFHLPRNNLRVMVGAGTAAAIGGSFLTPLAGVAFAMEVVVLEYTVAGFLPIIVSAVVASTVVSWISGQPSCPFQLRFDGRARPPLLPIGIRRMHQRAIQHDYPLGRTPSPPYSICWRHRLRLGGSGFSGCLRRWTRPMARSDGRPDYLGCSLAGW